MKKETILDIEMDPIPDLPKKYGPWQVQRVCENCRRNLSDQALYYNCGICPYCAHSDGGTIVPNIKKAWRKVTLIRYPSWQIWRKNPFFIETKKLEP